MHSPHSQGWGSSSLLLSLPAPDLISLLSPERDCRTGLAGLLGSLAAPRICLAQRLQEQAQLHGHGSALGQACCQYGAAQQDKAGTQQELLLLEEICIYKRVKNRCKIHSKKKGHNELAWSARQDAFFPL